MPAHTSPTLHPISPPTVHQLSRLALLRVNRDIAWVEMLMTMQLADTGDGQAVMLADNDRSAEGNHDDIQ